MNLSVVLALRDILLCVECLKAFFYAGIVDTQKLVLRSSHVAKIRLALATFLIEELVHRLICRGFSQVSADDLVQRFPQMRRAAFGCRYALMAFHPFPHCLFNLLGDTSAQGGSTCANRMLRMREAADGLLCGRVDPRFLLQWRSFARHCNFENDCRKM